MNISFLALVHFMLHFLNILWLGVCHCSGTFSVTTCIKWLFLVSSFLFMYSTCIIVFSNLTWISLLPRRGLSSLLLPWWESKGLGLALHGVLPRFVLHSDWQPGAKMPALCLCVAVTENLFTLTIILLTDLCSILSYQDNWLFKRVLVRKKDSEGWLGETQATRGNSWSNGDRLLIGLRERTPCFKELVRKASWMYLPKQHVGSKRETWGWSLHWIKGISQTHLPQDGVGPTGHGLVVTEDSRRQLYKTSLDP